MLSSAQPPDYLRAWQLLRGESALFPLLHEPNAAATRCMVKVCLLKLPSAGEGAPEDAQRAGPRME